MFVNNLPHYYFPLALAAAFGLIGACLVLRSRRGGEPDELRGKRFVGCLLVAVGLLVAGGILTGPTPGERTRYLKCVLNVKPSDVAHIVIAPEFPPAEAHSSPVHGKVVVRDAESIRAICGALNAAEPIDLDSSNYRKVWRCKLRLTLSTGTYDCHVCKDWKNQCFVSFESDRGFYGMGTSFGEFRSDSLGKLLEWLPRTPSGAGQQEDGR